jgi:thioredoxin reductase (NADPH)
MLDYLIVGAGPAGLSCAIEAKKNGLSYLVVDKGCAVNSIYRFPSDMSFFSTPELLEIGDAVFVTDSFRPTRAQVLKYYMSVIRHYGLNIASYREVTDIAKEDRGFKVTAVAANGNTEVMKSRKLILATGYYDNPNKLGIDGEELEKVSHYYGEAHPYYDKDVAVIGGKNSAVEASLAFYRAGARVTLIHRGKALSDAVKYWIRPDIEKRLQEGEIKALFNSVVKKVRPDSITVQCDGTEKTVKNDFVFALTGYHPDMGFLKRCGIRFDPKTLVPEHNSENLETNVPGLYLAGSIAAGMNCNKIFIENSRHHGKMIITRRL